MDDINKARMAMAKAGLNRRIIDMWTVEQINKINNPRIDWVLMAYNKVPKELI